MTYDINRLKPIHSEDLNYSTVIIKCNHSYFCIASLFLRRLLFFDQISIEPPELNKKKKE